MGQGVGMCVILLDDAIDITLQGAKNTLIILPKDFLNIQEGYASSEAYIIDLLVL